MPNFFKSFFSGKSESPESEKQKAAQKNFEMQISHSQAVIWQ